LGDSCGRIGGLIGGRLTLRKPVDLHLATATLRSIGVGRELGVRASLGEKEKLLSTLVAIAYPDADSARQVMSRLVPLQKKHLIEIEDAVLAVNEGGKIKLEQSVNMTSSGAFGGAVWGGLLGLIFLVPVAGLAIGAAAGAIAGRFSDYGIDDDFARDIAAEVTPGSAALFLLVKKAKPDRVIAEMQQFRGKVLGSNLSDDAEHRLQAALSGQPV
jgi:uncharacterized membrane protein